MKTLITLLLIITNIFATAENENKTSVGVGIVIEDVEISGSKVIPVPRTDYKTPIVLRIVSAEQTENGYLYSIHAEGLDPGNYDLTEFIKRADNTTLETEAIPLEVYSVLDTPLTEPRKLTPTKPKNIGGYKKLLIMSGVLWVIGLVAIIYYKKTKITPVEIKTPPPTLTEKISALLKQGQDNIDTDTQAQLERLMIGHWIEKFPELEGKPIQESLTTLRNNEESGDMIRSVEKWLHSGEKVSQEEIERTLAPYAKNEEEQK